MKLKLLFSSYILAVIALFFYSFTQVDLSLTLSQSSIYQTLEKQLQYVGFFQRPLSALIFIVISIVLFLSYFVFLHFAKENKLNFKSLRLLILVTFVILVFSYNGFSYDLFNYIFDAKILTFYHQNPYLHRPTDFLSDPMLNFMRWTHRTYPYGPSWLVLTLPLSFVGLNYFLPTFFLFKIMIGLTFLGSCYLIYKISEIIFPKDKIFNTVFFALNPLVIIEGLVSSHNDFPLVFFGLLSIYLYIKKKKLLSFFSLVFSIGIKYLSVSLIPVFAWGFYLEKTKKEINFDKFFRIALICSLVTLFLVSLRTTFQPWYLIFPFSLGSLIARKYYVFIPVVIASATCLMVYVTYVFMTDYAKGYPQIILNIELIGLGAVIIATLFYFIKQKYYQKIA